MFHRAIAIANATRQNAAMPTRADCVAHDAEDPLKEYRSRFALPEGVIYLDGNSLGALPHAARERVRAVVADEWGRGLIRSWNDAGWIALAETVGAKIAQLIGAKANEVIACDSTSVNLFKLLAAALMRDPGRRVILTNEENFPTDGFVAAGLADWLGDAVTCRSVAGTDVLDALDQNTAVLTLTHVDYRTGALWDMAAVTRAAHEAGALMLWDLSHSAGAVPLDLNGCAVDLAVGCGYKYLNGGPGAPAYLYVAEALQDALRQPIAGWMGHAAPFAFAGPYEPAPGIARMLVGTPPVIQLAALDAALDPLLEAGMPALRAKSARLTALFIACVEAACGGLGLTLASPRDAAARGSQVSFQHGAGYAVMQALIARGVIGDFRAPDLIRFGFAPLYLRYADVWDAADTLRAVLQTEAWRAPEFQERRRVT